MRPMFLRSPVYETAGARGATDTSHRQDGNVSAGPAVARRDRTITSVNALGRPSRWPRGISPRSPGSVWANLDSNTFFRYDHRTMAFAQTGVHARASR